VIETLQNLSDEMATLVTAGGNAIVRVEGRQRQAASGIIWRNDGLILTAHHVLEREEGITVGLPDGTTTTAEVVGRDPGADVALLRISASDLTVASWVDDGDLKVGHLMLALGRPGQQVQATLGIISALGGEWRTHAGGVIDRYVQTDVVMYPGFSGGPLVAADGRFAGMNTSGLTRGTSVAVPTSTLQRIAETILAHGHIPRGYLGIGVQPVRLADALQQSVGQETGLMVMSVEAGGPAATAGLLQGDVLTQLDGTPIRDVDTLQAFLGGDRVGKVLQAQLLRGGVQQRLAMTVGQSRGA